MLEMRDYRVERGVLVMRRTEIAQMMIGLFVQPLCERRGYAGFADPGFARQQHYLAFSILCALPSPQQKFEFLAPTDERCRRGCAQCLEPARDRAGPQHLPGRYHSRETAGLDGAEVVVFEQSADEPPRTLIDQNRVRLGQALQSRGEVRGLADDIVLGSPAPHDDCAGGDPNAGAQLLGQLQARDGLEYCQGAMCRPLGIVFMRMRISEIDQDAVAHIARDEARETPYGLCHRVMISANQVPQIFGVASYRQCGRADEVAEHDGELSALAARSRSQPDRKQRRCAVR